MNKNELLERTRNFAIAVFKLCQLLPDTPELSVYKIQLIKSSSSVGANYRAACRAKSTKDFIYKLKIVEEECDESGYFLGLIEAVTTGFSAQFQPLITESNELTAIFVASLKTSKAKLSVPDNQNS